MKVTVIYAYFSPLTVQGVKSCGHLKSRPVKIRVVDKFGEVSLTYDLCFPLLVLILSCESTGTFHLSCSDLVSGKVRQ